MTTDQITNPTEATTKAQEPDTVTLTLPRRHYLPNRKTPLTKDGIAEDMITDLSCIVDELGNISADYFMSLEEPEIWKYGYQTISSRIRVLYHHLAMVYSFLAAAYNMPDQYFRDQLETLIIPGE